MKFECAVCNMEFPSPEQLNGHNRTRHGPPPGPEPRGTLTCSACNVSFATEPEFQRHMQGHRGM